MARYVHYYELGGGATICAPRRLNVVTTREACAFAPSERSPLPEVSPVVGGSRRWPGALPRGALTPGKSLWYAL